MVYDNPARAVSTTSSPASGTASLPGRELLVRLGRAVQRATIYPPSHPAVRTATSPVYAEIGALLGAHPQVVIGITTERLLVGTGDAPPAEFEVSWLSKRLAARGIASIAFDRSLEADDTMRLVSWLAHGEELAPGVTPPAFSGVVVVPVDMSHARFREAPMQEDDAAEANIVWRAMARALVGDWPALLEDEPPAPAAVASRALELIDINEGTGVSELAGRLFGLAPEVTALGPNVEETVKRRLGEFVGALSPELRGQLLTVAPSDDPAKLELLTQLIDRFPRAQVMEVISNLQVTPGDTNQKFLAMLVKLVNVAAADPLLTEAVEERFRQAGLPADIAYLEAPEAQRVLEELFAKSIQAGGSPTPASYQNKLDEISRSTTGGPRRYDPGRNVDPASADDVALEVGHIALQLLGDGEIVDRVACLGRVEGSLPRFLTAGRFDTLVRVHEACERLTAEADVDRRVVELAGKITQFFPAPDTVTATVEAIGKGVVSPGATLYGLARAAGTPLVAGLVDAVGERREGDARGRFAQALLSLDPDVVRAVVTTTYRREPGKARSLLAAVSGLGVAALGDVAILFIGDDDNAVRFDAFRILFENGLSPARSETVLRKALEDRSPRIVDLALAELAARAPSTGPALLGGFLSLRSSADWERHQRRAVALLLQAGTPAACAVLVDALGRRHRRLGGAARRVSFDIVEGLEDRGDAAEGRAVHAYRRSPAGLLGRLLGQGRRAAR
jgi:hypothetical protein